MMHADKFPGWEFNATDFRAPNGSRCIGFATDDPGKFEGWHAIDHQKSPLLMIIDEAKTVKDGIYEAKARCQPTRELLVSSPGGSMGQFYKAFGKNSHLYSTHTITAYDCPHISKEWIAEQIDEYGIDHPFIRSMIFAEFMDMGEDGTVIPLGVLERNLNHIQLPKNDGSVHAFCDFAAGGDENVLALRKGNVIKVIDAWRDTSTMSGCGKFISWFTKLNLKPQWISGDAGGMGKVWCDRFDELGWNISRVNFGGTAQNKDLYFNRIAEIWGEGARAIDDKKFILPDDDDVLIQQLTSRKWDKWLSDGRMKLVSKDKMRADGVSSPDRAECVLGCMLVSPESQYSFTENKQLVDLFSTESSQDEALYEDLGINVGY